MKTRRISEQRLIERLERGRDNLATATRPELRALVEVIRRNLDTTTTNLYVLHYIAEQGEDLYEVLVDGTSIVKVEIPRGEDRETSFVVMAVDAYAAPGRSRSDQRMLETAIKLARERP
jgi:hypothetical protein